ncbi:hypothetical protein F511_09938 [Dorcoceras hygrometricum]|uniref:Uncharacterized protein n=1 Tax=Dorcoceras hygrometricum TaxID=472368 RepID=A0A2Z7DGB2_9LAMI|nr:hypothetical protein F511_09938 [Dorcoceras hygrometricum]
MLPASAYIGPKTSWAARDRPEQYLEENNRRNGLPERSPDDGGRRQRIACGSLPHDAAPSAAHVAPNVAQLSHVPQPPLATMLRSQCARRRPTVGHHARPARMASRGQHAIARALMRAAPGSDQFHEETGTSNGIQLAVGPQLLWLRNHNFGLAQRIMVKCLATARHDPLGITNSACKNQLVVVSVHYGPFYTYIPIRSTTIDSIGYPRMKESGESSTTKHRLLHASGPHPIPPPNDPKTNQYNQDLGLIHSTNGNNLESPNEGSSIDHQVTIHLHAQNITMFPTNETWYFTSQMIVSSLGGLILILTAQSTRNEFRMHSDY